MQTLTKDRINELRNILPWTFNVEREIELLKVMILADSINNLAEAIKNKGTNCGNSE